VKYTVEYYDFGIKLPVESPKYIEFPITFQLIAEIHLIFVNYAGNYIFIYNAGSTLVYESIFILYFD